MALAMRLTGTGRVRLNGVISPKSAMPSPGLEETRPPPGVRDIVIAVLVPFQTLTGPGRQLAAAATSLRPYGLVLHPVVFMRPGTPAPYVGFLQDEGVPCTTVEDRGPLDIALLGRVADVLRLLRPHILQTHGYKASAVAAALSRPRHLPWVGFFHGWTTESARAKLYHRLERVLLQRADRIVVVARGQASFFKGAAERVRVIDNAILDAAAGRRPSSPTLTHVAPSDRPLLGVVGRLSSEKGVDLFLHALSELNKLGRPVFAVIVGDGPERKSLNILRANLGLDARVRFLGHLDDVRPVYKQLDALVIPSRSEGLPNVLLEALAADVPVIATAVGAIPDVLGNAPGTAVVRAHSPEALLDGIQEVLLTGRSKAAHDARREIVAHYSMDRRVQQHVELYGELLQDSAGQGDRN